MFTFHWSELLVVVIGGLILLLGLALLILRRRNEILQEFLTPEDRDLEEEFFRVRAPKQVEENPEESGDTASEESGDTASEESGDTASEESGDTVAGSL